MTRRTLLLLAPAALCRGADASREVLDLFTDVAASLSAGNLARFLTAFDPAMRGYATLRENVAALVAQGEVQSLIEAEENEGTDRERAVELQWTLRIRRGQDATPGVLRRQTVKCHVEKRAGKWRITQFEPVAFFAPGK